MAVYTHVSDDALESFIALYDIGELHSFKGIAEGVENSNYLVQTDKAKFILTLYEKRVNRADLPFFLGLMQHLASKGLACPTPLQQKDGRIIGELEGRAAAIISFLEGMCVQRPQVAHCEALGKATANLHLAAKDFALTRPNDLSLAGWHTLFASFKPQANSILPGLEKTIADELDYLDQHWPKDLPQGVIHADLFTDNVFFLKNELSGIIDYYFACNDMLAYELAICMNAWCFEADYALNITKSMALFRGYETIRPLSEVEKAALPVLARGAALRFLLTRSYDWLNTPKDAIVRPKNPDEYLRKLRFHQNASGPAAYGLA